MTVVLAARIDGSVWFAADAMSTDTDYEARTQTELVHPKIIAVGDALVGLAGEHVLHTVVRYHKPPAPKADESTVLWMQKRFLPWLEKTLSKLDPKRDRGNLIVGRGEELFKVERNNVDMVPVEVAGIGTGEPYALGALHATRDSDMNPHTRVLKACEAACWHDPYCGGRIDVMTTKDFG